MSRSLLRTLLSVLVLFTIATAQTTQTNEARIPSKSVAKKKAATDPEAERIRKERREQAQALLISGRRRRQFQTPKAPSARPSADC